MAPKAVVETPIIQNVEPEVANKILRNVHDKAEELVPGIVSAAFNSERTAICKISISLTPRAQKEGGVKWYLVVTGSSTLPTRKQEDEVELSDSGQLRLPGIDSEAA